MIDELEFDKREVVVSDRNGVDCNDDEEEEEEDEVVVTVDDEDGCGI